MWKLAGEGLRSGTPVLDRVPVENARRRMLQLLPPVGLRLGPGVIDVGARLRLDGHDLPSGPALVAGYFFDWCVRCSPARGVSGHGTSAARDSPCE